MSSRICEIVALAIALAGCGSGDRRTIDVCGRGDRPELAAALDGGELAIEILGDDGDLVSSGAAPAGDAARLELDFAGGARVRVIGRAADGAAVATGEAALGDDGACVCLALSAQAAAACGGLTCLVEDGGCRFLDGETGEPAGPRTVALEVERDTTLLAAAPDQAHADDPNMPIERARAVGLVRFDMTRLPARSIIDGAELELSWAAAVPGRPPRPISIHRVAEPWDEAATWLERSPGQAWSAPGCDGGSCAAEPIARMATDGGATSRRVPLGLAIAGWLDPAQNHGLALRSEGNPTLLRSAESPEGSPARLLVTFHLAEDQLPDPEAAPICGDGLVEGDEQCDDGDEDDDDACTGCRFARCGDGVVRTGVEECDHGGSPDQSCTRQCLVCDDPDAAATWIGPTGRCYTLYLSPVVRQYGGAESACDAIGHGHLAALRTRAEHDEVIAGLGIPPTTPVWIGLSDRDVEGTFVWASGLSLLFTSWAASQPSDGIGEDCVALTGGTWNDTPCNIDRGFVCERAAWASGGGGTAYRVVRSMESWDDAELVCEAVGAHLAAPTSAEEHTALTEALTSDGFIGLGEGEIDGEMSWVTGEELDFTAFPAAPDLTGDRFCAHLDPTGWLVAGCTRLRRFVCEAD
jgi:hypothetical protein